MNISYMAVPGLQFRGSIFRMTDIMAAVEKYYGLEPGEIKSKSQKHYIVRARMMAVVFSRIITPFSYARIGAEFGKDHATCIHAVRTVRNMIETDKRWSNQFHDLSSLLGLNGNTEMLLLLQNDYTIKRINAQESVVEYKGAGIMHGTHKAAREFIMARLKIQMN